VQLGDEADIYGDAPMRAEKKLTASHRITSTLPIDSQRRLKRDNQEKLK
jgi:hypothetical protein